jgi:hypothetical protein
MLKGKVVKCVREMTEAELDAEGWIASAYDKPLVIEFSDGTKIYAAQDPEGNGPGTLFGVAPNGDTFYVEIDR